MPTPERFWNRPLHLPIVRPAPKVPMKDVSVFCRKLAFLLEAGLTAEAALSVLGGQAAARPLREAVQQARGGVMRGQGLAPSLAETGAFPAFLCALCAIGEMTARLPYVMAQLAAYYERQARTEEELNAALIYPVAVTLMLLSVTVLAVMYVLPGYTRVFTASGVTLPAATRLLLGLSGALTAHGPAIGLGACGLILAALAFFRTRPGKTCGAYMRLYAPVYRVLYRQTVNLRLAQALSLLLSSGQTLTKALAACADMTDNPCVRRDIRHLTAALRAGRPFGLSLAEIGYIDPLLQSMAQVGEETGRLPQALDKCREYFEEAQGALLRRLNKLVEPVITLVLGLLLGLVMMAVILPTFALTQMV